MNYAAVRMVHECAVALSVTGFFIRGLRSLLGTAPPRARLARGWPHVVDTVLLLSAITLAWMLGITPVSAPWLMAKVCGLGVYIGLGVIAMRPGVAIGIRFTAWTGALVTVGWIISVAITKRPLGALSLL